ncbi:30S ribosomal protein S9 [Planctopirus ephydatiae]|uniref:Small ribosomal subunit protein uS9 n=1 Tax=Planctopirus ephydatiae TaxID=2528019 RepID=A0A518GSY9_9PLAN|nr:30S ribosomal protein S9 [Planctopirus ephydatiae]
MSDEITLADPTAPASLAGVTTGSELTLGSEVVAPVAEVQEEKVVHRRGRIDRFGVAMGTGRRKTSVARVRLKPGSGSITINDRTFENYFPIERDRLKIEAPLRACEKYGQVDIWVRAEGGGSTGQTGAVILGIARALDVMFPNLHQTLADGGYLTRDSRMVERKKYGFKKARRSFQFSKR